MTSSSTIQATMEVDFCRHASSYAIDANEKVRLNGEELALYRQSDRASVS